LISLILKQQIAALSFHFRFKFFFLIFPFFFLKRFVAFFNLGGMGIDAFLLDKFD